MTLPGNSLRRRLFYLGCAVLLALSHNRAIAMWTDASETELIEHSPLIVVGTLVERLEIEVSPGKPRRTIGILRVEQLLKAAGSESPVLVMLALPRAGGFGSSSDIHYELGQQGLWFLAVSGKLNNGIYSANHPQRFVPMASAAGTIERVRGALGN